MDSLFKLLASLEPNIFVLQVLALGITVFLIPRLKVTSIFGPILTVLALAAVDTYVWDGALFLAIPDEITYKAAVVLLSNGALFWILVKLLPGIEVSGVLPCIFAPVVFSVVSMFLQHYLGSKDLIKLGTDGVGIVKEIRDDLIESGIDLRKPGESK